MSPIIALKTAFRQHLLASAPLTAALGGPHVHDEVPRSGVTPYVVFAEATARENGTSSDRGHIVEMTLHVWSSQGGSAEALALGDHVADALDDTLLPLQGHRMVTCRLAITEARRMPEKNLTRVALRFRIITETL